MKLSTELRLIHSLFLLGFFFPSNKKLYKTNRYEKELMHGLFKLTQVLGTFQLLIKVPEGFRTRSIRSDKR